ncbi:hypothetical protein ACFLRF_04460 [Candidatus Altiarchaeota archaeon]
MFPATHAWTTGSCMGLYCLASGLSPGLSAVWVFTAVFFSLIVDLDHLLLPLFFARTRRTFRDFFNRPLYYLTHMQAMRDILHSPGTSYGRLMMHILFSVFYMMVLLLAYPPLLFAGFTGLLSHVTFDVAETIIEPGQ